MTKAADARRNALYGDDVDVLEAERKAAKYEYKAAKQTAVSNRISKTTGYGLKALSYSIKSDKVAVKAAKARSKMASNDAYIAMMNRRLDSLDAETLRRVEKSMTSYLAEAADKIRSNNRGD